MSHGDDFWAGYDAWQEEKRTEAARLRASIRELEERLRTGPAQIDYEATRKELRRLRFRLDVAEYAE